MYLSYGRRKEKICKPWNIIWNRYQSRTISLYNIILVAQQIMTVHNERWPYFEYFPCSQSPIFYPIMFCGMFEYFWLLLFSTEQPYQRIFWQQSISCEFSALIKYYSEMPSNKITKRIKNAFTEDNMQSALALVNSTTQSIRSIVKEVSFLFISLKNYKRNSCMYPNLKNLLKNLTFSFFFFTFSVL